MSEIESVVSSFKEGFSCSQSVVVPYAAHFGLSREVVLRISAGFGGGMGRMAGICGAVTGAFMVIGLKYGGVSADDKKAKERTYRHVREFANRFKARNGVITCKELLGCDIGLPSGMEMAKEKNFHTTVCPKFVKDAAEILEDLIDWD